MRLFQWPFAFFELLSLSNFLELLPSASGTLGLVGS